MAFFKNLFTSPKKPKLQPPPKQSDAAPQQAMADLERQRALAQSSTILTNQSGYGNVGNV